ncbi:MAG: hypothetical protein ACRD9R_05490 [Pyrinomonadaceae bacterium]
MPHSSAGRQTRLRGRACLLPSKFGLLGYAESLRDHVRKVGANVRVFNFCPGLVDVERTGPEEEPRPGFVHPRNMACTLMYALQLDRNVVVEDINLYAR